MFHLYDGRTQFYQWDINQKLIVDDESIEQVHFATCMCADAKQCETYTEDGTIVVNVPNELLTLGQDLRVWGYDGNATKHSATFGVIKRTKPADYIYTEEEIKTWEKLYNLAFNLSTNYNQGNITNKSFETRYQALLDLPIRVYTNYSSISRKASGTPTPYNIKPFRSANAITFKYSTEYLEQKCITVNFEKPFYSGTIYWTDGYYHTTRKQAILDTSKLVAYADTSGTSMYVGLKTTVKEQGWDGFVTSSRTQTLCDRLTYSTSKSVNYRFNIDANGNIYIVLKDELRGTDNQSVDEVLPLLEGTEFIYSCTHTVNFEPMPSIIGAQDTDDITIFCRLEDGGMAGSSCLLYHTNAGEPLNEQLHNLQDYIDGALEDRLNELENKPQIKTVIIDDVLYSNEYYEDITEMYADGHIVKYEYEDGNAMVRTTTNAVIEYENECIHLFFPDGLEIRLLSGNDGQWEEV